MFESPKRHHFITRKTVLNHCNVTCFNVQHICAVNLGSHVVGHLERHLYKKRDVYYYGRRVPTALQKRFNRVRVVLCLHTGDEQRAIDAANRISVQLETAWNQAQLEEMGFGTILMPAYAMSAAPTPILPSSAKSIVAEPIEEMSTFKLSDALDVYLRLKGKGRSKLFFTHAERNMRLAINCLGDLDITAIRRSDAGRFRDFLVKRNLSTQSIRRVLATLRASINFASSERGIDCQNAFSKTYVPTVGIRRKRLPIPTNTILSVQQQCIVQNDNRRWLIALISDSGMRLAEATGLIVADIHLDEPIPYVDLVPHKWRPLKTLGSTRKIPLVGASLWAARQAVKDAKTEFLFPDYTSRFMCNANSASAALLKWLKPKIPEGSGIHSLRHSMRDRLRAVECPSDIQDAIGGWQTSGVGHGYGSGYQLDIKAKWLEKIALIGQAQSN